jgi:hypothetical protein
MHGKTLLAVALCGADYECGALRMDKIYITSEVVKKNVKTKQVKATTLRRLRVVKPSQQQAASRNSGNYVTSESREWPEESQQLSADMEEKYYDHGELDKTQQQEVEENWFKRSEVQTQISSRKNFDSNFRVGQYVTSLNEKF